MDWYIFFLSVFRYALIVHVTPLAQAFDTAHVPSESALVANGLAIIQALDKLTVNMAVIRMYAMKALLIPHALFRQQVAVKVVCVLSLDVQSEHPTVIDVERTLQYG